ncbi:hypothetical protein ACTFIW_009239 [Dictyostelium discoideum]
MDTTKSFNFKEKVRGFLGSAANVISPIKDHDLKEVVGQDKFWKIYQSTKKTTNTECSLFVFEKKLYEKVSKSNLENVITFLKKEATTLQRLRHPSILQVVSVMEETKTHIHFATEPILATLEDLLGYYRQRKKSTVDQSSQSEEGYKKKDFTFEELELKAGIFQILDGLLFLNQTAKLLHRNISPESIFITKDLKWKLGGLGFTCSIETKEPPISNLSLQDLREYQYISGGNGENSGSSNNSNYILPQLDYLAPEFISQRKFETNSDLFSIGRLIFELSINLEQKALDSHLISQLPKLGVISYYNTMIEQVRRQSTMNTQRSDSAKVCTILLGDPMLRGDLENFIRSSFFQDVLTKTLLYLANISQKEDESKLQFFRGLLRIVQQFSPRIQNNYILPVLLSEISNDRIIYVLLPNIMSISANHVKKETFQSKVLPAISNILQSKEPKPEVLSCVLENLPMLLQKCSLDQIKKILLPICLGSMCGPTNEIIFQCLSTAQPIAKFFDTDMISVAVIPRLTNLCVGGFPVHIRTKAIQWFTLLVPSIEKKIIVDSLLPNLEKILAGDNSPVILQSLVETYEALSKKLGGELLAKSVLPALIPLSSDKHIDLEQFKTVMKVIRDILNTYEQERINELSNLQRYTSPTPTKDENDTSFITVNPIQNNNNNNNNNNNISPTPINLTLPNNFGITPITTTTQPSSSSSPSMLFPQPSQSSSSPLSSSSSGTTSNPFNSVLSGNNKALIDSPDFGSTYISQPPSTQQLSSNISLTLPKSPPTTRPTISNSSNSLFPTTNTTNNNNNNNNNNINNNSSNNNGSNYNSFNNSSFQNNSNQPPPQQQQPLSFNSSFDFGSNLQPTKPTHTIAAQTPLPQPKLSYNSSFDIGNSSNNNNNNNNNSTNNNNNLNSFSNFGNNSSNGMNNSNNNFALNSGSTLPIKSTSTSKYDINLEDHVNSSSNSFSNNSFSNNNNNNNNNYSNNNTNNNNGVGNFNSSNSFPSSSQSNYGFDQPLNPTTNSNHNSYGNNNYGNNSNNNNNTNSMNSSFKNMDLNQNNSYNNTLNDFNSFHNNVNSSFNMNPPSITKNVNFNSNNYNNNNNNNNNSNNNNNNNNNNYNNNNSNIW